MRVFTHEYILAQPKIDLYMLGVNSGISLARIVSMFLTAEGRGHALPRRLNGGRRIPKTALRAG
ncbi:hypothetical protein [Paraburkholderia sp. Ac-20347]|uniref:hypothetical protein n=1 Tax=Paraburkholderia sp. Ac-20347 TaxID=2703892 RepID=UPI001981B67B|nr:hypothetical protein [Paraburkholderia sp. Ac-20347]MBN3812468.1 hypothetical protein [Paraburkholderia sp. Ac-20347]